MQPGKTRWARYSIAYHFAWIPRYRRKILTGEIEKATRESITECCLRHGLILLEMETDHEHIHVVVSAPPRYAPADIANLLKGYSARCLRARFPQLKQVCGKDHLWTQSYFVGTAGSVSTETIRRYIMDSPDK